MNSFQEQLRKAGTGLPARKVAEAISPFLSVRVVESWMQGRTTPPAWCQDWILDQVRNFKR